MPLWDVIENEEEYEPSLDLRLNLQHLEESVPRMQEDYEALIKLARKRATKLACGEDIDLHSHLHGFLNLASSILTSIRQFSKTPVSVVKLSDAIEWYERAKSTRDINSIHQEVLKVREELQVIVKMALSEISYIQEQITDYEYQFVAIKFQHLLSSTCGVAQKLKNAFNALSPAIRKYDQIISNSKIYRASISPNQEVS